MPRQSGKREDQGERREDQEKRTLEALIRSNDLIFSAAIRSTAKTYSRYPIIAGMKMNPARSLPIALTCAKAGADRREKRETVQCKHPLLQAGIKRDEVVSYKMPALPCRSKTMMKIGPDMMMLQVYNYRMRTCSVSSPPSGAEDASLSAGDECCCRWGAGGGGAVGV